MPLWLQRFIVRLALKVVIGDYRKYGLPPPDHKLFERHPAISSELFHYLKHGKIAVHPDVRKFDGHFVEFVDGVREEFDVVVAATGYHLRFPFLEERLVSVNEPIVEVYGYMAAAGCRHLYIFGWMQPRYGFGPLVATVADLLAQVIKTQDDMRNPIGSVLKWFGQKPPRTNLCDPNLVKLRIKWLRRLLPFVRLVDRWILARPADQTAISQMAAWE